MNANYINPFLSSSIHVIENFLQVKPSIGEVKLLPAGQQDNHVCMRIGIVGQFQGDVIFSFPTGVALSIVSAMMGGYPVSELDEMSQSAISELANMISGNASTQLFDQGIKVDITPPSLVQIDALALSKPVITVPLRIHDVGEFKIMIA